MWVQGGFEVPVIWMIDGVKSFLVEGCARVYMCVCVRERERGRRRERGGEGKRD